LHKRKQNLKSGLGGTTWADFMYKLALKIFEKISFLLFPQKFFFKPLLTLFVLYIEMTKDTIKHEKLSNGHDITQHKKNRSILSYAISIGLGVIAFGAIISILIIEVKGRNILKTPEEWSELIKEHPYERKETDVRSPCPMLNTLANHGFIARDGRNIKSADLFNALMLMGAPPMVSVGILGFVYSQLKEPNPESSFVSQFGIMPTLDLDRLTIFGVLEHDVSLTRNDTTQEPHDTQHVVPEYVHRMLRLAEYTNNNTEFEGIFTRKNENDARRLRWLESAKYNRYMHLNLFSQV
jgi:hypothetical protein